MSGRTIPAGHRLVPLSDAPELWPELTRSTSSLWPEIMLHDAVVDEHWSLLAQVWSAYQLILLDASNAFAGAIESAPLDWDGTDEGLPDGWDDQLIPSARDQAIGRTPNTLGALQIAVAPDRRGEGLSHFLLDEMLSFARARGLAFVIACVRPNGKAAYPLMPIDTYAAWRRTDGLPFDPWLRVHARAGGRIVRGCPRSMTIAGTIAEMAEWTGLEFPVSGAYIVAGALQPVEIDVPNDRAVYHDANIWVVHDLR